MTKFKGPKFFLFFLLIVLVISFFLQIAIRSRGASTPMIVCVDDVLLLVKLHGNTPSEKLDFLRAFYLGLKSEHSVYTLVDFTNKYSEEGHYLAINLKNEIIENPLHKEVLVEYSDNYDHDYLQRLLALRNSYSSQALLVSELEDEISSSLAIQNNLVTLYDKESAALRLIEHQLLSLTTASAQHLN